VRRFYNFISFDNNGLEDYDDEGSLDDEFEL
jgi:hypothetical protein